MTVCNYSLFTKDHYSDVTNIDLIDDYFVLQFLFVGIISSSFRSSLTHFAMTLLEIFTIVHILFLVLKHNSMQDDKDKNIRLVCTL